MKASVDGIGIWKLQVVILFLSKQNGFFNSKMENHSKVKIMYEIFARTFQIVKKDNFDKYLNIPQIN